MGVKVTDYSREFEVNTTQKASIFVRMLCEEVVNIAEPKTPYDKGNLSRDVIKEVTGLKGKITWDKDYAAYQERGKRYNGSRVVKNYSRPGTGPGFAINSVKQAIDRANTIARATGLI